MNLMNLSCVAEPWKDLNMQLKFIKFSIIPYNGSSDNFSFIILADTETPEIAGNIIWPGEFIVLLPPSLHY